MNARLQNLLEKLRASFWFIPALMLLGAWGPFITKGKRIIAQCQEAEEAL
ncbi:MAG: hypothetical protein AAGK14_09330 [Verrucomicrobiota bacterium]